MSLKCSESHIFVESVLFPFQNYLYRFETGGGPFQKPQIIYCFYNLIFHIYLSIGVYIIYIQFNFHNNLSFC